MIQNPQILSRRRFVGSLLAAAGVGAFGWLGNARSAQPVQRVSWMAFGTLVDVAIADPDRERVDQALAELAQLFARQNRDWHPWQAGQMRDINSALATGRTIVVDRDMVRMVEQIKMLHRQSRGSFNPAIGKMVAEWGFHQKLIDSPAAWTPPRRASIEALLAQAPTPLDLELDGNRLSTNNPATRLDLGGYAKGYAIDRGVELLDSIGIQHAIVNAGGDLMASGSQYERPWMIGIRNPLRPGALAWLETEGREAVFTSGTYERYHQGKNRRYAHIINPRSGEPVEAIVSATVIHRDAALADAAATALVAGGLGNWRQTARDMDLEKVMVIDRGGDIQLTDAMRRRIVFG